MLCKIGQVRFSICSEKSVGCLGFPFSKFVRLSVVCVCVVFPFILDVQVRLVDVPARATQEAGHTRISHPPSFCGTRLNFFREKDSAVFSFSFSSFFLFLFVSKNPSSCDCTGIRTHVPTSPLERLLVSRFSPA